MQGYSHTPDALIVVLKSVQSVGSLMSFSASASPERLLRAINPSSIPGEPFYIRIPTYGGTHHTIVSGGLATNPTSPKNDVCPNMSAQK